MSDTLLTVKCRGCHRQVGVGSKDYALYCTLSCQGMPPATSDEERDSLIELLARKGKSPTSLAMKFDISRQRVHQILQHRHVNAR